MNSGKKHFIVGCALLVVAVIFYQPIFSMGFFSDDYHALYVAKHQNSVLKYFTTNIVGTREGSTYGPLWNLLVLSEYKLFAMNPLGHQVVGLLLFVGAAFFIYLLGYQILHHRGMGIAAALLFLAMPSHVEALAWIAVQIHLFPVLLYLVSIYCYYHFVRSRAWQYYVIALASIIISLLTKEIGITFPAAFVLIELFFGEKVSWQRIKIIIVRFIPIGVILIAYLFVRAYATGLLFGYYGNAQLSFDIRALFRMFTEMNVNLIFSYPERVTVTQWLMNHSVIWVSSVVITVSIGVLIVRSYRKELLWLLCMYGIVILPYLNVQYNQLGNEGERYTYFPSVFIALMAATILFEMTKALRYRTVVYSGAVIVLMIAGSMQIATKLTYWTRAHDIVQNVVASMATFSFSSNDYALFVGLPDQIYGAHIFRNGIREAFDLYGYPFVNGERVLQGLALTPDNAHTAFLNLQQPTSSTIIMTPTVAESRTLTGLPVVETKFGTFTLEDFRKNDHTGERILVELDTEALQKAKEEGERVMLVYYSPLGLQSFPL